MIRNGAKLARIVPAPGADGQPNRTQGTQVFVGEQELTGITRIELVCDVGNVWRARIDCMVQPPADLKALAIIHYPSRWQRFKRWLSR